ncbi:hypothetical protein ACJEIK_26220 [Mycobacterium sp. SMC-16]|uniref:hypothetical protein n=1 Tax=Mycobacterium sp. SMC-16 TaxID=3385967 RepID=UPI00390C58A6
MANALYDKGREAFLTGGINWLADSIKAVLVDTGAYTVNLATHQFLSDIAAGARVATSANLSAKTVAAGVADAADSLFTAVSGPSVEAVVLYKDTGTAGTSALIAYIDTASGLPVTPNGGDITVTWDNGANKIFKL